MAGLQQGDREGEDEVTRHHQQQQDPKHVGHHGSIDADEEDEKTSSNLAVLECWSAPQRVEVGEGQQDAWEHLQCGVKRK